MEGFQIYNASAGSGKTYQLTKHYLLLLLSNIHAQRFRKILALTFTNKAVAEMKDRILQSLWTFGNKEISKENYPLFLELAKALGYSHDELEEKCSKTLKLLLHNYDFFEVSTIDKFTHRIIKTFAKDLKIAQNFEVELDGDTLLDEAIGTLLQNAATNESLQSNLIEFALEKVDSNKSWNIIYNLKDVGQLLFNENHYAHLQALSDKNLENFDHLKAHFRKKMEHVSQNIIKEAEVALGLIETNNLEFSDFKGQYFPKFMLSLQSGNQKVDFKAAWKQNFDSTTLYNKSCPDPVKAKLDRLHPKFSELFHTIKKEFHAISFFKNAYTNVLPLSILNEIAKEVSNIQREKETLHISEFNKIISKEIANQPVPYIYERLGERYRHYFIDEFQDTSQMQWENLVPLIGNALETEDLNGEKGSLMLVGDAKQSIYRWRGGNPKQFLGLNDQSQNPFTVEPKIAHLNTNWRSFDNIIKFNNDFFQSIAIHLKQMDYQELYLQQCQQKTNKKTGGYIEIKFAPKDIDQIEDFYCEGVLRSISRIITKGFHYKDICVLTRKKDDGISVANYLAEHNIPVISSETLLLNNNSEVQFLVSLLRFLNRPFENILQYEVLEYLFKDHTDKHDYILEALGNLPQFLKSNHDYIVEEEMSLPLLDILERAILTFGLSSKCGAHVIHFLDTVEEFSQKKGLGIYSFLSYWDEKRASLAISAPQDQNAVQLMTVHKSKGLEFRFVIFPFADAKINARLHEQKVWVPLSGDNGAAFEKVLVNANNHLEHYSLKSKEIYDEESNLSELDDFNVLYVAMTRAIEGLFILTQELSGANYGQLFKEFLVKKKLWGPKEQCFRFGHFSENTSEVNDISPILNVPYSYTFLEDSPVLSVSSQSLWNDERKESAQWGILIHSILAEINSQNDIKEALLRAKRKGDLTNKQFEKVETLLKSIVNHPELSKFYTENVRGMNEIELLDIDGVSYRPDRMVIDKNQVTLIDYKTGIARPSHTDQLKKYAKLIQALDSSLIVDQKILVYIGNKIEPVFI